jgi:hypothetical protein
VKPVAIIDLETDPFERGLVVQPFASNFYDGTRHVTFWGPDCVRRMATFLAREHTEYVIFAHNGGKFDWVFFLPHISPGSVKIVNGRILRAKIGRHEIRDSFALMPFALEKYQKTKIDYDKFKASVRDLHRDEIISYLKDDCVFLYDLVVAFLAEFGDKLTVGSAALKQLKTFHSFTCGNKTFDATFRDDFYFGGRVQCFETGLVKGDFKVYDVNSMYPFVMAEYLHPVGTCSEIDDKIRDNTCFVVAEGHNHGAFPTRTKTGGLDFTKDYGVFHTSIHEWRAALDTGTFKPDRVITTYGFDERITFAEFVDHFYSLREIAKHDIASHCASCTFTNAKGKHDGCSNPMYLDALRRSLFYKYVLNSAYGKFAQNPENFSDWELTAEDGRPNDWHDCDESCEIECKSRWLPAYLNAGYTIWQRPSSVVSYYNVATGASITGAARAVLLRGLHAATRPIYCDTDSITCERMDGVDIHPERLGAWDIEATCSIAAICGKKLYGLYSSAENPGTDNCVKKAHKGGKLTGSEIVRIARGETIEYPNPVPNFKFGRGRTRLGKNAVEVGGVVAEFTKRRMKRTA